MFETLEDIKKYCGKQYATTHSLILNESKISESPPQSTYYLKIIALPPLTGKEHASDLAQLKVRLDSLGYQTKIHSEKVLQKGFHIELSVKDRPRPLYSIGAFVSVQSIQSSSTKFKVISFKWNKLSKEFLYYIETEDHTSGFKAAPEAMLSKYKVK